MNQQNPKGQYRNRLIAAIRGQQSQIATLQRRDAVLTAAVQDLVKAAGVQTNQRFASLMSLAGTPDEAPDTTTEQAKQPMATDDVTSPGAAPAPANTGVTPDATTDVQTTNVALPEDKPLDNLQDVTQVTPGTDAPDPAANFNGDVKVSEGDNTKVMDPPGSSGWSGTPGTVNRTSARGEDVERFTASQRLARLQISAGIAQGEDLSIAQGIFEGEQSLSEINSIASTLTLVQAAQQPTRRQASHRGLVPQSAARATPSLQSAPQAHVASVNDRGDDEWGFGAGDDLNV